MKKGINIFLLIAAIINIGVGVFYNIFVADALNDYLLYLCIATVIAALCMRGWLETKNESDVVVFVGAVIPFVLLYIITGEKNPVFEVFATFLNLLCIRQCMKDMSGAKQPVICGAMTLVALLAEYYVCGTFCVLSGLTLCAAYAYAVRAAKPANGIIWKIYWVSIFATAFMGLFIMAHGQIVKFVGLSHGRIFTEGTYRSMSAAWGYIPVIGLIVLQLAAVLCIFYRARKQEEPIRRVAQVCSGAALLLQIAISVFASLAKLPYIGAPLVTVQGMAMTVSAICTHIFCEFWQNEDISDDGEFGNDICDE